MGNIISNWAQYPTQIGSGPTQTGRPWVAKQPDFGTPCLGQIESLKPISKRLHLWTTTCWGSLIKLWLQSPGGFRLWGAGWVPYKRTRGRWLWRSYWSLFFVCFPREKREWRFYCCCCYNVSTWRHLQLFRRGLIPLDKCIFAFTCKFSLIEKIGFSSRVLLSKNLFCYWKIEVALFCGGWFLWKRLNLVWVLKGFNSLFWISMHINYFWHVYICVGRHPKVAFGLKIASLKILFIGTLTTIEFLRIWNQISTRIGFGFESCLWES